MTGRCESRNAKSRINAFFPYIYFESFNGNNYAAYFITHKMWRAGNICMQYGNVIGVTRILNGFEFMTRTLRIRKSIIKNERYKKRKTEVKYKLTLFIVSENNINTRKAFA